MHGLITPIQNVNIFFFFLFVRFHFFGGDCPTAFSVLHLVGARRFVFFRRAVATDEEADGENGNSGLRRACSLSDLSKPSPRRLLPSPPNNGISSILFRFSFVFFSVLII